MVVAFDRLLIWAKIPVWDILYSYDIVYISLPIENDQLLDPPESVESLLSSSLLDWTMSHHLISLAQLDHDESILVEMNYNQ